MKVLATYSMKGGVGKTTTAVNLAARAAEAGHRTLSWDLDPQGAATFTFGTRAKVTGGARNLVGKGGDLREHLHGTAVEGLDLLPADFSLRHLDRHLDARKHPTRRLAALLAPLADSHDLVVIDCAPALTLTSEGVFLAADALLVPVVPTTLSVRTVERLMTFLDKLDDPPELMLFASMVDRRKRLHCDVIDDLASRSASWLGASIPAATVVERMGMEQAPVHHYSPRAAASQAYGDLWQQVADRLW